MVNMIFSFEKEREAKQDVITVKKLMYENKRKLGELGSYSSPGLEGQEKCSGVDIAGANEVQKLLDAMRLRHAHALDPAFVRAEWESVVQQIDKLPEAANRFAACIQVLAQNLPRLVLYLDNLESLLVGPNDAHRPAAL